MAELIPAKRISERRPAPVKSTRFDELIGVPMPFGLACGR